MDQSDLKSARILIVDDVAANVLVLRSLLEASEYANLIGTTDPRQVVTLCAEAEPDLILLDLHMPEVDGYEVMGQLQPWIRGPSRLPVVVVTADITPDARRRALSLGARDFVTKPLDPTEVTLRVANLLENRLLQRELRDRNRDLERRVHERTRELEAAQLDVLTRLAYAAEFRDDETGEHTQRIGRMSELLALQLGVPLETAQLIRLAAPLHDLGKLAVPDAVLLKPASLTPEEYELVKSHVTIGGEILSRGRSQLIQMCEEIALSHHERWDGSGYPLGLRGEAIPLTGRIVAVADSFDALTHGRAYRRASTVTAAVAEIQGLSGTHFDPRVVEAFEELDHGALVGVGEAEPRA